jgi:hypothetical protein
MEATQLTTEITNLIELTNKKKINWSILPNNPAYVKWDRNVDSKTYQISIQSQNPANPLQSILYFNMQKIMPQPQELILQINTGTEPQYKELLGELFSVASASAKNTSASLLESMLKGL